MNLKLIFLVLFPLVLSAQDSQLEKTRVDTGYKAPVKQVQTANKTGFVTAHNASTKPVQISPTEKQRDWIDIVSGLGSIATVATLIFLLFIEVKTRKDVKDLAVVARTIGEQNRLLNAKLRREFKPDLSCEKLNENLNFQLVNRGSKAIIKELEYYEINVVFEEKDDPPIELAQNGAFRFKCRYKSEPEKYVGLFRVLYYDALGNLYFLAVRLHNGDFTYFRQEPSDLPEEITKQVNDMWRVKGKKFDEETEKRNAEYEKHNKEIMKKHNLK